MLPAFSSLPSPYKPEHLVGNTEEKKRVVGGGGGGWVGGRGWVRGRESESSCRDHLYNSTGTEGIRAS
jgi:hypothetical protein